MLLTAMARCPNDQSKSDALRLSMQSAPTGAAPATASGSPAMGADQAAILLELAQRECDRAM